MKRSMSKEEFLGLQCVLYRMLTNHEAAENTAIICSLLATCKAQEITPREWLNDVIAKLPYYLEKDSGKDVLELFPDVWKLEKSNTNTSGV